jgi:hypothetical protein
MWRRRRRWNGSFGDDFATAVVHAVSSSVRVVRHSSGRMFHIVYVYPLFGVLMMVPRWMCVAFGPYLPLEGLCQIFKSAVISLDDFKVLGFQRSARPSALCSKVQPEKDSRAARTMKGGGETAVEALADWCLGGGDNLCCFCVPCPSTNKATTATVQDPYPTYIHESAWTEHNTPAASKQSAFPQRPPWFPKRNE